jgi:hypothetical protein
VLSGKLLSLVPMSMARCSGSQWLSMPDKLYATCSNGITMRWSATLQGAGAVWDIWQRRDLDTLRAFLFEFQHLFPVTHSVLLDDGVTIETTQGCAEISAGQVRAAQRRFGTYVACHGVPMSETTEMSRS